MSFIVEEIRKDGGIKDGELRELIAETIEKIPVPLKKILLLPPDITRLNSRAGQITAILYEMLNQKVEIHIMPTLGTHAPMTEDKIRFM